MNGFFKVLRFELNRFLKNKLFIGITLVLSLLVGIVTFYPRIEEALQTNTADTENLQVMLIKTDASVQDVMEQVFAEAFPHYNVQSTQADDQTVRQMILDGDAACAVLATNASTYTYYTSSISPLDYDAQTAQILLQQIFQGAAMLDGGLDTEQVSLIMNTQVVMEVENLRNERVKNLPYAFIVVIALYMVTSLYGQMVASNVASEKGSRAMELLITSSKTTNLIFGKVMASCLASLLQLGTIFGTAILGYKLNADYWNEIPIISTIFQVPTELVVYMVVFFVLGYLLYAFLYGAIGSMASKPEDLNSLTLPMMLVILVSYILIYTALSTGEVDTMLMQICSYIPLTSPMAMFARICVGSVSGLEIAASLGILGATVLFVGITAAKIYSIGVLLYGKPPRLSAILKAIGESQ